MALNDTISKAPAVIEDQASSAPPTAKHQPWKAVWPAPRDNTSKVNGFGFKKGETMIFDGNAGNFFAKDSWTVEQESDKPHSG